MKKTISTILTLLFCLVVNAQNENSTIYVNDMDYVLGDVKQRFITGAVTTEEQADNLLIGFKTMKVNGIRIPIFPRDAVTGVDINPNKAVMDYFYEQALAEGFLIFANPAQGGGGARIANNSLTSTSSVNGLQSATDELVNRVIEFSNDYPDCKWLNPFNEDGKATSSTWTVSQINEIYQRLYNHGVNGAELIGPCTWGVPAGIDMLQNTNIADYITVASSHNLGHNDSQWSTFRALADAENLPMWDSEANNDAGGTSLTKVEAAIANKVDGLVVYNTGNNIYLSSGALTNANYSYMDKYLKFRTDKTYYIDCTGTNKRLASTGSSEDAYGTSTSTTGDDVEWKFVEKGNGYYHIERAAGGSKPRIRTDYTDFADMQSSGSNGTQTYFTLSEGWSEGSYHLTLPDISSSNKRRLQITDTGVVKMVTSASTGSWVSFTLTEAGTVSSSKTISFSDEISTLTFPNQINTSKNDFKPVTKLNNTNNYGLTVYNIRGHLVFSTNNYYEAWIPASTSEKGIYIYHVNYIDNNNNPKTEHGKVLVE